MEEIDDIFPLFEMLKIHEFAWFPKIKTLTASCFLQNIYFFLNFWKKHKFFMKIGWFCQKCKAMSFLIFYTKNKNSFLGIESVKKIWKFSWKSSKFISFKVSQQARLLWMFFCILSFFTKWPKMKAFSEQVQEIFPKNTSKTVLNWLKSLKYNQFDTFRTCHTSKNQLVWFSNFLYVFINEWFSKGFIGRMYWNYVKNAWISKKIRQRTIHP